MTEQWLPVPGYVGLYEVSDQGRVRSLGGRQGSTAGRILAQTPGKGCLTVKLSRESRPCTHRVHKLVLLAFVGPCPPGLECCHENGDHTDNHLGNLRWDTSASNKHDTVAHGTHHWASKTHCLRQHRLVAPNLLPKSRGRQCRACNAARAAHRDGRTADMTEYANAFYARLGVAA